MLPTVHNNKQHREILQSIAHRVMLERGLLPDFSAAAMAELGMLRSPTMKDDVPAGTEHPIRDLRDLLWASIDNDDSLDLDQLTVAEAIPGGEVKMSVAIADVDAVVRNNTAIDQHARHNTTSVYTAAETFPMLPVEISTDITSLNFNSERLALVIEMMIDTDGSLKESNIYHAWVRNHAKLAYNSVAAWLDGKGVIPEAVAAVKGLDADLRLQDDVTRRMKNLRHIHGALSLETIEAKPVFDGDQIRALEIEEKNRAKEIIEDLMIAANGVTVRYLSARKFPRSVGWYARQKGGSGLLRLPTNMGVNCQISPIQKHWRSSSSRKKPPILCASRIYRWQ